MKFLSLIFLASLIIVKIVLGSIFIYQVGVDPLSLEGNAIASEPQKDSETIVSPARLGESSSEADGPARRTAGKPARHNPGGENANSAVEEEIDLNFLLEKRAEIEKKEEELAKKRADLIAIQEDINNKIAKLTQLRNEIRAQMATKKTVQTQKLKHLIKAYSAMKPQKAASLIEKLDMTFAIELLSEMKGDVVGNILSFTEIDKAARISEQLAKRK